MEKAVSKDGTTVAYNRTGTGPALVLVDGAFGSREFGPMVKLVPMLANDFTVYHYDRRGRGGTSSAQPWSVEREVEDLEAIINEAGGSAYLYGISSGAALALKATTSGLNVTKLAIYESPFVLDDSRTPPPADLAKQLEELAAQGKSSETVKTFLTKAAGVPPFFVGMIRMLPAWQKLKSVAATTPYDTVIMEGTQTGKPLPPELVEAISKISVPTLVMGGGRSPAWLHNSVKTVASIIPGAQHQVLKGQMHNVTPKAVAPVLLEFFRA